MMEGSGRLLLCGKLEEKDEKKVRSKREKEGEEERARKSSEKGENATFEKQKASWPTFYRPSNVKGLLCSTIGRNWKDRDALWSRSRQDRSFPFGQLTPRSTLPQQIITNKRQQPGAVPHSTRLLKVRQAVTPE